MTIVGGYSGLGNDSSFSLPLSTGSESFATAAENTAPCSSGLIGNIPDILFSPTKTCSSKRVVCGSVAQDINQRAEEDFQSSLSPFTHPRNFGLRNPDSTAEVERAQVEREDIRNDHLGLLAASNCQSRVLPVEDFRRLKEWDSEKDFTETSTDVGFLPIYSVGSEPPEPKVGVEKSAVTRAKKETVTSSKNSKRRSKTSRRAQSVAVVSRNSLTNSQARNTGPKKRKKISASRNVLSQKRVKKTSTSVGEKGVLSLKTYRDYLQSNPQLTKLSAMARKTQLAQHFKVSMNQIVAVQTADIYLKLNSKKKKKSTLGRLKNLLSDKKKRSDEEVKKTLNIKKSAFTALKNAAIFAGIPFEEQLLPKGNKVVTKVRAKAQSVNSYFKKLEQFIGEHNRAFNLTEAQEACQLTEKDIKSIRSTIQTSSRYKRKLDAIKKNNPHLFLNAYEELVKSSREDISKQYAVEQLGCSEHEIRAIRLVKEGESIVSLEDFSKFVPKYQASNSNKFPGKKVVAKEFDCSECSAKRLIAAYRLTTPK